MSLRHPTYSAHTGQHAGYTRGLPNLNARAAFSPQLGSLWLANILHEPNSFKSGNFTPPYSGVLISHKGQVVWTPLPYKAVTGWTGVAAAPSVWA